ncbi:MAG: bifunctional diaminohydroxyphosphoribosylaminopyrimidine deaminase/5-amino-6-(5-phosphoribosylamino)uracil reductase RibD [Candidatus Abyssobacteria bacterium SURF_5]|uniref:Riboflavin biosynthesis protein RibD n=1 Tax=Abyssobacteria bacterium (strain SURF_5) TaxID=2093360 RepID=A0A3A4NDQ7_ABYX5|nr:MAG: bifunctional diaminohydroxyphosphoribosylaminopyrimidine deaminase/5-amino-6-(5-phosphoribosylamino)uracil reductase RibD [Candidatus Abyssubacteria bacterium SURF_5]
MSSQSQKYMARALELAALGRGFTSPNPLVGAVIVKNGKVIGEGFHRKYGEAHAEVAALQQAVESVRGSTLYVTLEPCCHYGKTPPCTEAVIKAGIAKVVMAMEDPNPLVSCKGKSALEGSGIAVETGVLADEANRLNEWYVKFVRTNTPFFTAKAAMTLDGKIATHTGDSRWVTGEKAREYVHWLRAGADAILVGSRTVKIDDPLLTTRTQSGNGRDALRIVIDGEASISPEARVLKTESSARTMVVVKTTAPRDRKAALEEAGAQLLEVDPIGEKVDLKQVAALLGSQNIANVLIEGGGGLLAAAFEARIVDKVLFFVAPKIFGGKDAPTPVGGAGVAKVADAYRLRNLSTRLIGEDILIEAYVEF